METYSKKRIEIVIEAPALSKVLRVFDARKVLGYTIVPALAGSGHEGRWESSGSVGESGRMLMVVSVLDGSELDLVLSDLEQIIRSQIGIVLISDVQVIRRDHF